MEGITLPKKKEVIKKPKKEKISSDVTEIVCVVDRSGSMEAIKNDAIGGFNNFLTEQQKLPGNALMTVILFDHEYQVMCSGKPIAECQPFDSRTYVPRGSTALMDATGRAINELNFRNPKKAILMILTDGHENSSHEFLKSQIKQMIEDCKKKEWAVIYLSADANAFDDGRSFGLGANQIMSFKSDPRGANIGTMSMNFAAGDYRRSGIRGMSSMATYGCSAGKAYDNMHAPSILGKSTGSSSGKRQSGFRSRTL